MLFLSFVFWIYFLGEVLKFIFRIADIVFYKINSALLWRQ